MDHKEQKNNSRIKGNPGEIDTGVSYKKVCGCFSDGSPSAASKQPHLFTTTH